MLGRKDPFQTELWNSFKMKPRDKKRRVSRRALMFVDDLNFHPRIKNDSLFTFRLLALTPPLWWLFNSNPVQTLTESVSNYIMKQMSMDPTDVASLMLRFSLPVQFRHPPLDGGVGPKGLSKDGWKIRNDPWCITIVEWRDTVLMVQIKAPQSVYFSLLYHAQGLQAAKWSDIRTRKYGTFTFDMLWHWFWKDFPLLPHHQMRSHDSV